MNKNKIALAFALILVMACLWNNPFDKMGVIQTTINSTVSVNNVKTIFVATDNVGSYSNMVIRNVAVSFLDKSDIQIIANNQGPVNYHEFKEIVFVLIGFRVSIDHITMYPTNSTQTCYSCYGDTGIVNYRNGKWGFHLTGGWII